MPSSMGIRRPSWQPCRFPDLSPPSSSSSDTTNKKNKEGNEDEGTSIHIPNLNTTLIRQFCKASEITPATVIQLAWTIVLRWYTGSLDPCFGILCSRRDLPINGVNGIFGPLIGMLTCRVQLDGASVAEALEKTHASYLESLPYQTVSLAEVHNALGLGSDVLFNSVVSFQKTGHVSEKEVCSSDGVEVLLEGGYDPTEYGISVRAIDSPDVLQVIVDCQWKLGDTEASQLGQSFSTAIESIVSNSQSPIKDLDVLSAQARNQLWDRNSPVPEASEIRVHDLIEDRALVCPDKVAISGWDDDLTYQAMAEHAGRLANSLIQNGLVPESVVPLCFEKSKWTAVAMLAVLRAGCAFVLLDPSQPENRLFKIIRQTNATVGLSSRASSHVLSKMVTDVIVVGEDSS